MSDTDEELASKVPEVRQKFCSQFAENIDKGVYDDLDLERLNNDDKYVECFLLHQKLNVEKAVNMVDSSLRFRKDLDLNNLTEKSFPRWVHDLGAVYYHSSDKDDTKILYFQVAKTKKDPEYSTKVRQFIAWWIDKHFLANFGTRLVVLFDMTDAGISNMDIELVKFQISCFSTYYPALLKYMLIFDMPWILNTIWKVIKTLLTAEQQKAVIMVKPKDIKGYIPAEKLWKHMGGEDDYQYQYIPSEDSGIDIPNGDVTDEVADVTDEPADVTNTSAESTGQNTTTPGGVRKRVTFAEKNLTLYTNLEGKVLLEETTPPSSPRDKKYTSKLPKKSPVIKARPREDDIFVGPFAAISPSDHFVFSPIENSKESGDVLSIANISDQQIAFKVKTTSPDCYRVRPSTGLINPKNAAEINIFLSNQDNPNVLKDKFLVMAMKVDDSITAATQLSSMWKSAAKDTANYMDHRLSCRLSAESAESSEAIDSDPSTLTASSELAVVKDCLAQVSTQMELLINNQRRIDRRVSCLFIFHILVAVTTGVVVTIIVVLSLLDIDINPFSSNKSGPCTNPWH